MHRWLSVVPIVSEKRKKIEKELEQIKRMQSITDVIDKSNSENTLLYTSSRENESLSDDVIDNMLTRMTEGRETDRNIRVVEGLSKETDAERSESVRARASGRARRVRAAKGASPRRASRKARKVKVRKVRARVKVKARARGAKAKRSKAKARKSGGRHSRKR